MSAHGNYQSVTIANGGTASTGIEATGTNRGSFQLPTMTGTTTRVDVSNDNVASADLVTNWTTCPIEGNEVTPIVTTSNGTYSLPVKSANFRWLRLVSGSAEGAARTILIWTP